jgi:hypothetical protein
MQADIHGINEPDGSDDFSVPAYLRLRLCRPSFGAIR